MTFLVIADSYCKVGRAAAIEARVDSYELSA